MNRQAWIGSLVLIAIVLSTGTGLALWKRSTIRASESARRSQHEPIEVVTLATAHEVEHQPITTAIGTVLALQSIELRNELAGTVRVVHLEPGQIVEAGELLVGLDVEVEQAALRAQEARAALADSQLQRLERAITNRGASESDVDRARAERAVALAEVERLRAVLARKEVRAPFRARVGLADVHPGRFLEVGTLLTTLQGVEPAVHIDFRVPQEVAAGIGEGAPLAILTDADAAPRPAVVVARDAKVDPATRSAWVRARYESEPPLIPGSSVRVSVPVGTPVRALAVPVTALRRGPAGDYVYVIASDERGDLRASLRSVGGGPILGDEVLVLAGLTLGESVAAVGSFKLRDGALVQAAEPPEAQ